MKKLTLLLMSLLMVSSLAFAQKKLCVHKLDGTKLEVLASEVSYIDFEGVATDPDDDPVVPGTSTFVAKPFSVSDSKTVTFSPGNLQYHAANDEWRFAPNQTDYIGEANANISSTYNGWIDLFGWGTGNNPTYASTDYEDYQTFVDWGVNKIGNYAPNTWRTLTYDEWYYLYYYRSNADKLIGVAQVNGVNGLILLPDNWTCPSGVTFKSGFHYYSGTEYYAEYQTFSASEWAKLEASGAVFFPAAGLRLPEISSVQDNGYYWSATKFSIEGAYYLYFSSHEEEYMYKYKNFFHRGLSVRLVQDDNETIERKLYFVNKAGWTGVKAYIWSSEDGKYNITWPGESAYKEDYRKNGYEVYSYDMSDKQLYDMIIFNGLATSTSTVLSQTSDLEIDYSKPYYYDGIWFSSLDDIVEPSGYHNGYAYVDLGLPSGTKWATMNVGADSPEDYGDYFAWGETQPKDYYDFSTYKWCKGDYNTQTKYCTDLDYGTVDNKTILELSDDAANANWGGSWRMPTEAEQDELRYGAYTTWTWTRQNGVNGYKVTSRINGNSIFLPAAGYLWCSDLDNAGSIGYYWSSSLSTGDSNFASSWFFTSGYVHNDSDTRYDGQSVRPVLSK